MSAATEQNNGDVAVEKVAAPEEATKVKEDLKKAAVEESTPASADNGTPSKDNDLIDKYNPVSPIPAKGLKRPSDAKSGDSKKAKKDKNPDDSDDDEVLAEEEEVIDSIIESGEEEYDIPYEEDFEAEDDDDDDDDDDDGSGSDE